MPKTGKKEHLYERARQLNIGGRSRMDKGELIQALQKAKDAATRKARGDWETAELVEPARPSASSRVNACCRLVGCGQQG